MNEVVVVMRHGDYEFAWLIEWTGLAGGLYWDGAGPTSFTADVNKAVRFTRKEDAERVINAFLPGSRIEAREHGWCRVDVVRGDDAAASVPAQPEQACRIVASAPGAAEMNSTSGARIPTAGWRERE